MSSPRLEPISKAVVLYTEEENNQPAPDNKEPLFSDDLLLHIFSFLKPEEWGVPSLGSRHWKHLLNADYLWLPFAHKLQPALYPPNKNGSYDNPKGSSPKIDTLALIKLLKKNIQAEPEKPAKTTEEFDLDCILNTFVNAIHMVFSNDISHLDEEEHKLAQEFFDESNARLTYFAALWKVIKAHIFLSRIGMGSLTIAREKAEYFKANTENEKSLVSVAGEYIRLKQYSTAIEIAKTLQAENQGLILATIVYQHIVQNQWEKALTLALEIPEESDERMEMLTLILYHAFENNNMDLAIDLLLKTKEPKHAFMVMEKCIAIGDTRSLRLILELFDKSFSEPKNYAAEKLVKAYIAIGDFDKAKKIALFPQEDKFYNQACLYALRTAYRERNQPEEEQKIEALLKNYSA